MPNWQAVSKDTHANAGWRSLTHYRHAQTMTVVPVFAAEMGHLLQYYPLAFVKKEDNHFQLCALLGLKSGENAFLSFDERWKATYVPAALRSYPFSLLKNAEGKQVLAADVDSDFFNVLAQPGDQDVLSHDGNPHSSLTELLQFMLHRDVMQQKTDNAVQALAAQNVLSLWTVPVTNDAGQTEQKELMGMYHVDEEAVQKLPEEVLGSLAKAGALGIAYAQLFSQVRLKDLHALQAQRDVLTQTSDKDEIDLDKMFGESSGEDLFTF
ncbi:SapC [Marinomonas gallaica]|uniref:SapC n=1 Tax=Marinomonas gallaica TaxID=1806667 RepID=A0A1C3JVX6_9GAMM|nr:SapC family protein [Marinomonas gallaica]SBT19295.1 SapC [Marinomonas gallaica]SBT22696.1 SapC [Marinomonas gallaica]